MQFGSNKGLLGSERFAYFTVPLLSGRKVTGLSEELMAQGGDLGQPWHEAGRRI